MGSMRTMGLHLAECVILPFLCNRYPPLIAFIWMKHWCWAFGCYAGQHVWNSLTCEVIGVVLHALKHIGGFCVPSWTPVVSVSVSEGMLQQLGCYEQGGCTSTMLLSPLSFSLTVNLEESQMFCLKLESLKHYPLLWQTTKLLFVLVDIVVLVIKKNKQTNFLHLNWCSIWHVKSNCFCFILGLTCQMCECYDFYPQQIILLISD